MIFLAPASIEFSKSSLTTDAGFSIISPAEILEIVLSSKQLTFKSPLIFLLFHLIF